MKLLTVALTAAILLAGCNSRDNGDDATITATPTPPTPSPTATPTPTAPPIPIPEVINNSTEATSPNDHMQFSNCAGRFATTLQPHAPKPEWLPPGFQVTPTGPFHAYDVWFYQCESIILDNATLLQDVGFGLSLFPVITDASVPQHAPDGYGEVMVIEIFSDSPALVERFLEFNFPAQLADVTTENVTGPANSAITAEGSEVYVYQSSPSFQDYIDPSVIARFHTWNGTASSWVDVEYNATWGSRFAGAGVLEPRAGLLGEISPSPSPTFQTLDGYQVLNTVDFRFLVK